MKMLSTISASSAVSHIPQSALILGIEPVVARQQPRHLLLCRLPFRNRFRYIDKVAQNPGTKFGSSGGISRTMAE